VPRSVNCGYANISLSHSPLHSFELWSLFEKLFYLHKTSPNGIHRFIFFLLSFAPSWISKQATHFARQQHLIWPSDRATRLETRRRGKHTRVSHFSAPREAVNGKHQQLIDRECSDRTIRSSRFSKYLEMFEKAILAHYHPAEMWPSSIRRGVGGEFLIFAHVSTTDNERDLTRAL
jgi:hypothetical protein